MVSVRKQEFSKLCSFEVLSLLVGIVWDCPESNSKELDCWSCIKLQLLLWGLKVILHPILMISG